MINEAALQTNSIAFQAISTVWQTAELLGPATKSLGLLAGAGNEDALEMLLHPEQYGLTLSTTVAALRHAADNGNQKAIETLAAVAANEKQKPLWMLVAEGLAQAAESRNPVAIDALIAMSGSTHQNIRTSVAAGLARAAANQDAKALAALRQMNAQ